MTQIHELQPQTERGFVPDLIQRMAGVLARLQNNPQRNITVEEETAQIFTQLVGRQNPLFRYLLEIEASMPWISFPGRDQAEIFSGEANFVSFANGKRIGAKDSWMLEVVVPSKDWTYYIPVEHITVVKPPDLQTILQAL